MTTASAVLGSVGPVRVLQTPRVIEGEIVAIRKGARPPGSPARAHVTRHISADRARRRRLPRVEDEEEDEIGRGDQLTPVALSVSSAVGREDDAWGIVSRHADPITAARPPTFVVQRG